MIEKYEVNTNGNQETSKKTVSKIGLTALFGVVLLIAVLVTFSLTVKYYHRDSSNELSRKMDILERHIDENAYFDADKESMKDAALKAFVASAGDRYTVYYNADDFKSLNEDNEGQYVGIGVTVSVREIEYDNKVLSLVEVIKVHEGSPACEKGMMSGDLIYSVHTTEGEVFADDVGLDVLASKIKGAEGTEVTVSIFREIEDDYQKSEITMVRRKVEVKSVEFLVLDDAPEIGLVTISQFDLKTPVLLSDAITRLSEKGIDKIIIDLRDNGGGDLNSVIACAGYFLNENDLIISAEDNKGHRVSYKARPITYTGSYASCSVSADDIGKFRDISAVILVNENTASAAELLTAVFRDYKIAPIVGVNTFGKGTMQTIYSLEKYGIDGGMKITTDVYFPPCGESYDGVGIMPDVVVKADENEKDNQLTAAIEQLIK